MLRLSELLVAAAATTLAPFALPSRFTPPGMRPSGTAMADVVVSSNDGHMVIDAQSNLVAPEHVGPDTITVIDVKRYPPVVKATFEAPGSVVGPPGAIWISRDESWGIVTSATKADAAAKTGGISPTTGWPCST